MFIISNFIKLIYPPPMNYQSSLKFNLLICRGMIMDTRCNRF